MKQGKWTASYMLLLTTLLLGALLSACSPTSDDKGSSSNQGSPTATTSTSNQPVAKQPPGTGKAGNGKPLPTTQVIPLVFNLAYKDTEMERDIQQLYTPGSSTFHQYLKPDQVAQRYALSDSQLQQVKDWLTQNGYTVTETDALRSGIKVQGSVETIQKSLKIQLKAYSLLGREFYMQEGTPQLPTSIAPLIQSIVGLDNYALPEFKPPFSAAQQQSTDAADCSKYGAKQSLTSKKLAAAYQIDKLHEQGLKGQNQAIAVAEFGDPFDMSDIENYAACAGIATPKIEKIDVDGKLESGFGEGEAAMDIELIAGLAPEAQILVYQASLDDVSFAQALVDVFTKVAADNRAQTLSVSYGTGEDAFSQPEMAAVNRSLRTLAAQGISVFISSGDCGAYSLRVPNVAVVAFPASAPYAIAVGGTHLQVNDNYQRTSETVWGENDGTPLCANQWGSGGGVSQNQQFPRPSWQTGSGTTSRYDGTQSAVFTTSIAPVTAPNGLRQVPDVAAAAYPNIAIFHEGRWVLSGGTSASAPIWAAGALLVNQGLQQQGKSLLGSVPEMYRIANNGGQFTPYTDITQGNNLFYPATAGWDYSTGWGAPNFENILRYELAS